jgi:hypothetical protein
LAVGGWRLAVGGWRRYLYDPTGKARERCIKNKFYQKRFDAKIVNKNHNLSERDATLDQAPCTATSPRGRAKRASITVRISCLKTH